MLEAKLYSHAHVAGLKRLSARANAASQFHHRKVFFSFSDYGRSVITALKAHSVQIAAPLSEAEFQRIEATFKFCFPPDLRGILQEGLPVGAGFPDWRNGGSQQLRMWVNLPIVGICEAVEKGWFWWRKWGARPKDLDQAAMVARKALKKAPILLPVYGHCYMPTSPNRAGNPVFFIHQLEAFNCGFDVAEFLQQELFLLRDHNLPFQLPPLVDSVRPKLDAFGWNWEGSGRDAEIWDKNSDASTRNSDGLGRSSEASSEQEQRVSKSSVSSASSGEHSSWENTDEISEHKFYSSEALSRLSVIPLNESEKVVRRIEFWTDFVAKRQKSRNAAALASRDPAEPLSGAETDEDIDEFSTNIAPKWLGKVLNDISAHLRRGGWKEDDISEIVDASSPRSGGNIQPLDRQSVLEGLVLQLDFLSASLTKAGWSGQDVAETLSFDNQGKSPLKIPPKVAARIAPLASYVANA